MGTGHDTLWFSGLVPAGHVYAFDVQPLALERTRERLDTAGGCPNVTLILDSHEHFERYVGAPFDAGMFNLGYLPTSDRVLTTKAETSLAAVKKAVEHVKVGGTVVVVVYPGHPEGRREGECSPPLQRPLIPSGLTLPATADQCAGLSLCPRLPETPLTGKIFARRLTVGRW